jgi:hypothetical protein
MQEKIFRNAGIPGGFMFASEDRDLHMPRTYRAASSFSLVERLIGNGPLFLTTGHFLFGCFYHPDIFGMGACRLRRHRVLCCNLCPSVKGFPRRPLAQAVL